MSTLPLPVRRHALGLPAGSIRAILALGVVALICGIILMPSRNDATIPPYLIYLVFIMMGHFYAAHGNTIHRRDDPSPSPLYLPGGTVRVLLILMLAATVGWKVYSDEEALYKQFVASLETLKLQPFLPLIILGSFFFGVTLRAIIGRDYSPPAWQDFEAWVSLMAFIGISIAGLLHLVIWPTMRDEPFFPVWDACLGGVIAFYFGERS